MLVAVLLRVVVGLFLLAMQRFEAGVCPPDEVLGGPDRQGSPTGDRTGATSQAQVHGDRHSRNGVDVGRESSGRPIEGRGPWTHR